MLTQQSYFIALAVVAIVTLVALRLLAGWMPVRWPAALRWGLIGAIAGLLLTPSFPNEPADTLAPALVIVVFNTLFGDGWPSAVTAAAHLLVATLGATQLGVLIGWWRGSHYPEETPTRASV